MPLARSPVGGSLPVCAREPVRGVVVGGVLLVDTTADEPADAMLAVAVTVGGAVVGVDVLCGAVPPALLREAVAAAPALAAPLLGASSLAPAPR